MGSAHEKMFGAEIDRLRAENERLTRERDEARQYNKDWFAAQKKIDLYFRTEIDRLSRLNDAAERKVERLREMLKDQTEALEEIMRLQRYAKGFSNGVEHNGIEEAEYWHGRIMAHCETLLPIARAALKETGSDDGRNPMTDIPDDVVTNALNAFLNKETDVHEYIKMIPKMRAAGRVFVEWEREQAATRVEHSLCDVAEDESVFAALRTYFAARVRSRNTEREN